MSLKEIKNRVSNFLENEENDLIAIKGEWGIGKTYFWKELIKERADQEKIGKENYIYVSLFGVNNLSDLKSAILTSYRKVKTLEKTNKIEGFLKGAGEIFNQLEKIPQIGELSNFASFAAFQFLKDALICFDDLERKGDDLDFKELFGMATALKESKNCKIVFILNEEYLKKHREEFKTHGEKLIDYEIKFDRTTEEALECVFDKNYEFYDTVKDLCEKLEIKNIRILQRIKRFIDPLITTLVKCESNTIYEVLHSLVLFIWITYNRSEEVPTLEFIAEQSDGFFTIVKDEDLSEEEKKWRETLNEYNFGYVSPLDELILDYVKNGYFQESQLVQALENRDLQAQKSTAKKEYEKVWDIYYNSFKNNDDEFAQALIKVFKENSEFLSPIHLGNVVKVLRDLDYQDEADKLIKDYFTTQSEEGNFNLTYSPYQGKIRDQTLKETLISHENEKQDDEDFGDVIKRIARNSSYYPEDVELLANSPKKVYYEFLKTENSEVLQDCVKELLRFKSRNNGTNDAKIYQKTIDTLKKIANESSINRMRIERIHKVEIENDEE